jgi:hypothetical protein
LKILLFFIGNIAQFLPLVLFFVFFRKINKIVELRVVFLYVLVSLITNILLVVLNNYASLVISISAIIEYAFFSAFFYICIQNKKFKNLILSLSVLNICFEVFTLFLHQKNFDFWATLITAVLVLIYCIFFFYEEISKTETLLIYQSYTFWVATGCIIYLAGTLFLFLYTSDMEDKQKSSLWVIDIVFEIIKNIFFSIAFVVGKNSKKIAAPAYFDDDTNMFKKSF